MALPALLYCRLEAAQEDTLTVDLWIRDPEMTCFIEESYFLLQVLWDASAAHPGALVSTTFTPEDLQDGHWLLRNARTILPDVVLLAARNHPPQDEGLSEREFNRYWSDLERVPWVRFKVTLDPNRVRFNLPVGAEWDSNAREGVI